MSSDLPPPQGRVALSLGSYCCDCHHFRGAAGSRKANKPASHCAPKAINYRAVQPPSMSRVCPVMSEAAGEARKTTAPATSMGSPIR